MKPQRRALGQVKCIFHRDTITSGMIRLPSNACDIVNEMEVTLLRAQVTRGRHQGVTSSSSSGGEPCREWGRGAGAGVKIPDIREKVL